MQTLFQAEPAGLERAYEFYGGEKFSPNGQLGQVSGTGVFPELATSIRNQSALLALTGLPPKELIYKAYTDDLALLGQYQRDFGTCVRAAVRCSIIAVNQTAKKEREHRKETWALLEAQIPSSMPGLLIDFPYIRAALPVPQLLAELKDEFNRGVGQILGFLADWLETLVETEFIGLVEWGDVDVCRYHYFKHELTKEIVYESIRNDTSFDASKPYGSRTAYVVIRDREICQRQFHERHVHHIIHAKLYTFREYPQRVPRNVAAFIDAIPASLLPHMQIVGGVITKQEVHRAQVDKRTRVTSEILSVYKASPGILLGPFNLVGWSGDDVKSGSVFYATQQAVRKQARKERGAERRKRVMGHLLTA